MPFAEATTEYMQTVAFGSGDEIDDDSDEESGGGERGEGAGDKKDGGEDGEDTQTGGKDTQGKGVEDNWTNTGMAKSTDDGDVESGSSDAEEPSVELASVSGDKDEVRAVLASRAGAHSCSRQVPEADRTTIQLVSSDVMDQLIMAMASGMTRG